MEEYKDRATITQETTARHLAASRSKERLRGRPDASCSRKAKYLGVRGGENGIASMEGKYNPACKWLELHYPVAFRTFLDVTKLYYQEILKPSLIIFIIYSSHLITYPHSSFTPFRVICRNQNLLSSEAEKLAVLRRTESKMAEILRLIQILRLNCQNYK